MKKWLIITVIILIIAIPIAYYLISPIFRDIELNQESPIIKDALDSMDANTKAEFNSQVNAMKDIYIVRFEDFETINGPDLRIYLSTELGDSDFIELGKIKATKGNVNYNIPEGTDLTKYNKVLVWCKAFSVLFSYAEL